MTKTLKSALCRRIAAFFLPILLMIVTTAVQQTAKAQWIGERQVDSYSSQKERLLALSQSLSILEKANPMVDLRTDLRKGDTRFVGYNGVGLYLPGVSEKKMRYVLRRSAGIKMLKGSNDVLTEDLSDRLQKVARLYMEPYNETLMKYLLQKRKSTKKHN